jgi:hypothetical protein
MIPHRPNYLVDHLLPGMLTKGMDQALCSASGSSEFIGISN